MARNCRQSNMALADGTTALADGTTALADGTTALTNGSTALADGRRNLMLEAIVKEQHIALGPHPSFGRDTEPCTSTYK